MKSWTSQRRKGSESWESESEYSPGRRRKKKAKMIITAVATMWDEEFKECRARNAMCRMTRSGTGLTRFGGASFFLKDLIIRAIRKPILP
eukprot:scaffold67026_cov21-Cyclotella_meneghiniana.AAC.1